MTVAEAIPRKGSSRYKMTISLNVLNHLGINLYRGDRGGSEAAPLGAIADHERREGPRIRGATQGRQRGRIGGMNALQDAQLLRTP